MKKWEYQYISAYYTSLEHRLAIFNKLGEEGWEVVSVPDVDSSIIWVKRPIPSNGNKLSSIGNWKL